MYVYRFKCSNQNLYMVPMATNDGAFAGTNGNNNNDNYWFVENSGTTGYYYIRNAVTGQYLYVTAVNSNSQGLVRVSRNLSQSACLEY